MKNCLLIVVSKVAVHTKIFFVVLFNSATPLYSTCTVREFRKNSIQLWCRTIPG